MRQQQPRIIAPPHGDQLAAKEHRLFHPFQRAFGQHRLGMLARQHQRRPPPLRKKVVPPPREIEPRTRNPHPPGSHPHVAVPRQFIQKPRLARRGQNRIARPRKPAAKPLPDQKPLTRRKPLPVGEGLGWGNGAKIPRIPASVQPPLPNPPLKGREQPPVRAERSRDTCSPCARTGGITRQPDIPRHRHPPPPEPLPALRLIGVVHDPSPWLEANGPCCRFWVSRKIRRPSRSPLAADLLDRLQQRALGRGAAGARVAGQVRQTKLCLPASKPRAKVIHPDHWRLAVSL